LSRGTVNINNLRKLPKIKDRRKKNKKAQKGGDTKTEEL